MTKRKYIIRYKVKGDNTIYRTPVSISKQELYDTYIKGRRDIEKWGLYTN